MTLSILPDCRAVAAPNAPALADDSIELDNSGFLAAVRRVAASLNGVGVATGDVVAIRLPGSVDLVVSLFATWRLGATPALIDPMATPTEASHQIADSDSKVLIAAAGPAAIAATVRVITPTAALSAAEQDIIEAVRPSGEAPALISYGGGDPAMLDHRNLEAMCGLAIKVFALTDADHSLSTLPMRQLCSILVGALSPLAAGGCATMAGPVSAQSFLDRIERIRPTYYSAVPSLYAALSELPRQIRTDTSSVRFAICCAAPAGTELRTEFEHRYGISIINGYGMRKVIARAHSIYSPASSGPGPSSASATPRYRSATG
ncbi:AMP-binding protein [Nocardia abscessus]|uniref:class I adenylate-forming enzyme family protein n=1 Tax=Nocardia abscessus TaxID=120957 RepID=UPI001893D088|nr:AMP-binding protein [Nocardia abscessus]MBF6335340.1 AMP-binding protein [Nocardia abscessus]